MKITLKTLPVATAQEVFDQVATHLLNQDARSMLNSKCLYRFGKLKCAAGCLIGEDEYNENFESVNWGGLVRNCQVPPEHEELISDLQSLHDSVFLGAWPYRLRGVARDHGLNVNVVETFKKAV